MSYTILLLIPTYGGSFCATQLTDGMIILKILVKGILQSLARVSHANAAAV